MKNIEVGVIAEHGNALETMAFLARLTQRGHKIKNLQDIKDLIDKPASTPLIDAMMKMELHGTIKRFTPITIAIVGASRRFLAQARTNQVGINYVSASLQYSDYGDDADFVVPYALTEADHKKSDILEDLGVLGKVTSTASTNNSITKLYLDECKEAMRVYKIIASELDNDTAGYAAPQGLRNILIMQGNHEAWLHFLKTRTCNRNTNETQYVALRIWEELLKTDGGEEMFKYAGPSCMHGVCTEGKMFCGVSLKPDYKAATKFGAVSVPRYILNKYWPLLND
jgi:thymidylate synthase (FAD)